MKDIKDYYMNFYILAQSNYFKACKSLQDKYGPVPKPYFKMDSNGGFYRSKAGNIQKEKSISRWKANGFQIHHIREIEPNGKLISKEEYAEKCPFEWQMPNELCYCNILEHLMLHISIEKKYPEIPSFGSIKLYIGNITHSAIDKKKLASSLGLSYENFLLINEFLIEDFLLERIKQYRDCDVKMSDDSQEVKE